MKLFCKISIFVCFSPFLSQASHFLDTYFSPYDNDEETSRAYQGEIGDQRFLRTESDDFIKIPDKDYIGDLDTVDGIGSIYSGIVTFGHLPLSDCFGRRGDNEMKFDIAVVGAPFDTATSYRPGARFGPSGIREGSRRVIAGVDTSPFRPITDSHDDVKIVECGDVSMSPFDNRYALDQLYRGHRAILNHSTVAFDTNEEENENENEKDVAIPKILTLGGDHTITFSALRAVSEKHGPVTVLHFDSHIDTWEPQVLGGNISSHQQLNHGTFLHYAIEKGYVKKEGPNTHVGIRAPFIRRHKDQKHDKSCGFEIIFAREIDELGAKGIIRRIQDRISDEKVYM